MIEENRKIARISITPEMISTLLGLPADLRVRTLQYDPQRNEAVLMVEGEHLAEVAKGFVVPEITPIYSRRDDAVYLTAIHRYAGPVEEVRVR